jgi:hypothetical protein
VIEIDGPLWFVGAILVFALHALYLRSWRRERRADLAWWKRYDARAQRRHEEFTRAIDGRATADVSWNLYKSERGQA